VTGFTVADRRYYPEPVFSCIIAGRMRVRKAISRNSSIHLRHIRIALACLSLAPLQAFADTRVEIHDYTISVDYSLSRLWVEARFASSIRSIAARSRDAGKYLIDVRSCNQDKVIRMRNRRMMLPDDGIRCINYTVDLARAARHDRNYRDLDPGNIIVSPSIWLWRPEITRRSEIRARFRLPHDVLVSVPWKPVHGAKNTYRLSRSPESSNAQVIFGSFNYDEVKVPGATLRISMVNNGSVVDRPAILDWLRVTATDVSLTYGRFPNPSPQVVVVPISSDRSDGAVPFGRVIRDGGETVQFFINPERPIGEFLDDWTATHEFSHLMLPYLDKRHRWVSEGFAQYYQNVLLARSGAYDERYAWQKLYDGLERGRKSRPELSPNEAAEGGIRTGLMKVYWSGAAIALMADVRLRTRSGGSESLDQVLGRLQQCCLPGSRVWSGTDFFETLDSLLDEPVFMPLYRRYADTAGFPDTAELLAQLGLSVSDGEVSLRRKSEFADIRAAITGANPESVSHRPQLAAF